MKLVYVGTVANTHGLKGEVRILSTFSNPEVFRISNHLYIEDNCYQILSYRKHKNYDMVMLEGIDSIDLALPLKGSSVYFDRDEIAMDTLLLSDLVGMKVISGVREGEVISIIEGVKYPYLKVNIKNHEYLVPYVDDIVKEVNMDTKTIYVEEMAGLLDEN
jgi:16S rRNA processing protein RimM